MSYGSHTIVFRSVLTVSLFLAAVSVAGILSGSALLSDMASLSDDRRVTDALKTGRDGDLELRDVRKAGLEKAVAGCINAGKWPICGFLDANTEITRVTPTGTGVATSGWDGEDTYVIRTGGNVFRVKAHWPTLRPRYQELSDVINTRDHLSDLFPEVRRSFVLVFTLSLAAIGAIGIAVVFLFSRRLGRRVRGLRDYARQIATGELVPAPAATKGTDEIGILAKSMETMAKDLAETREKLIFAQKMHSWQAVARKVAHEIKNPLTPITVVAEQLKRSQRHASPELQEMLSEASRILQDEASALGRMVTEFTAFARLPEPSLEQADGVAVVQDFVGRNRRPGGPTFHVRSALPGCDVMIDRGMVMQVFHNLTNNAVLAKAPKPAAITFTLSIAEGRFLVDVADDGPGVPDHLRATLFDAYVTSRSTGDGEKGMGLGLTISRKIADDHGGSLILLQSGPDGTTFRLSMPLAVFETSHASVTQEKRV